MTSARFSWLLWIPLIAPALACSDDQAGSEELGDDGSETGDGDDETGDGDGDGDLGEPPADSIGCDGASFFEVPADPGERGPWAVGAATVVLDGVTTEIWYPAEWGSEADSEPLAYDIRYALPESEQAKISDAKNPLQICDCYSQLPIDAQHGPYPVVVFIHGTASWRTQSITQMTHWASRGFIVVSSDHAGLWLADSLAAVCGQPGGTQDLSGDTDKVLAALAAPSGDLEFLAGHVDTTRVAIAGHSAGGNAAATLTDKPGIRVSIPMASNQPVSQSATALESTLFLGGLADGIISYPGTQDSYAQSPAPKRLVGIENAGHLAFSDICELTNDDGQDILQLAVEVGVCGAQFAGLLFDCDPSYIDAQLANAIIKYSTTAVLEAALKCVDGPDLFAEFEANYPDVAEYQQEL